MSNHDRQLRRIAEVLSLAASAWEWPRCGEAWPVGEAEQSADILLRAAGIEPAMAGNIEIQGGAA